MEIFESVHGILDKCQDLYAKHVPPVIAAFYTFLVHKSHISLAMASPTSPSIGSLNGKWIMVRKLPASSLK